jgi:hypothetical protein
MNSVLDLTAYNTSQHFGLGLMAVWRNFTEAKKIKPEIKPGNYNIESL